VPPDTQLHWEDAYSIIEPQVNAESTHVWPFDPVFPIDLRFLRFGKRWDIRLNRHDYFELLYIHSGEVVYQVQDKTMHLQAGDLFVVGSTVPHGMRGFPSGPVRGAVLYFMPDLIRVGDSTGEDVEYLTPFLAQDAGFPHVVPGKTGIPSQVFDLMRRMALELPAQSRRARLSVKTYLKMSLILLVNHYEEYQAGEAVFRRRQNKLERLRPLFLHLDEHYRAPITIDEAAAIVHMSKPSFMRCFREVTGQSFVTYLNQFRVAKAEELLTNPDISIAAVAQAVGFADQSYFGRVFRTMTNLTPRQFKRQVGTLNR